MSELIQADHTRSHGLVRNLVDQDKTAGGAQLLIGICRQRLLHCNAKACDTVQLQLSAGLTLLGIDIEQRLDTGDLRRDLSCSVLQPVAPAQIERFFR